MRKKLVPALAALMALSIVLCAASALAMGTRTYYVACKGGGSLNIRQEPDKNARSFGLIPYGTRLQISGLSEDGLWGFCGYKNWQGWVMMSFLSSQKPPALTATPAPDATPSPADRAYDDMQALNQEFRQMAKQKLKAPYQVIVNTAKTTALYHLRWAPSFAALSIRSDVVNGDVFTVTAVGTNWLQVADPDTGLTGYLTKSITQPW